MTALEWCDRCEANTPHNHGCMCCQQDADAAAAEKHKPSKAVYVEQPCVRCGADAPWATFCPGCAEELS